MELMVWLIVPIIFFVIVSWIFKLVTRSKEQRPFIGATALSMLGYLYFRPTCGCIGVDQIVGAILLAIPFNFLLFLLGYVVALVLIKFRKQE
mgnify:CR=1 FL=1